MSFAGKLRRMTAQTYYLIFTKMFSLISAISSHFFKTFLQNNVQTDTDINIWIKINIIQWRKIEYRTKINKQSFKELYYHNNNAVATITSKKCLYLMPFTGKPKGIK